MRLTTPVPVPRRRSAVLLSWPRHFSMTSSPLLGRPPDGRPHFDRLRCRSRSHHGRSVKHDRRWSRGCFVRAAPPPTLPRRRTDNGGVRACYRGLPTMAVTASAAAAVLRCGGARVCCADIGKGCNAGRIRCLPPHLGRDVDAASSPAPFCIPSLRQLARCSQGMKTAMSWLSCVQPCSTCTANNIPIGHE